MTKEDSRVEYGKGIKALDQFGKPVRLTFRRSEVFKTTIGGYCTLICLILFTSVFVDRTL